KDLVVGQEDGRVALFINQKTNAEPAFNQVQYVKANGVDLDVSNSYFDRCAPEIADLNGDGLQDLILGQQDGSVVFYANSGSQANPVFTTSVPLKAGNFNLRVGAYSRPEMVDWDEDGDLDLLCGDETCHITLFLNTTISAVEPPAVTTEVPDALRLLQNYPNPFNATTRLEFFIPKNGAVTLELVNLQGQMCWQLVKPDCPVGWQWLTLDATHLNSGVYLLRLTSQGRTGHIKICVLR
ncbi:T9SS type A sorting domain-containing protein, partial [candidate division KSB1 bacterium]|nr:T9SS type A sorting domain-containing protein [candidate division KSB1 bacterium]